MADSAAPVALPEAERRAAEALLTRAFGEPTAVRAAAQVWDRGHVFRLHLASGRTAVLKRRRGHAPNSSQAFGDELAALDYLNAMPVPVAPRLLGADAAAGLLLMEDLGDGATLADSLMAAGRERVRAELTAYAQAMGTLHAWSMGHPEEAAGLRARHGPGGEAGPRWRDAVRRGKEHFLTVAATLGVATDGVAEEIDQVHRMITGRRGLPGPAGGRWNRAGTGLGEPHDGRPGRRVPRPRPDVRRSAGRRRRMGNDHDAAAAAGVAGHLHRPGRRRYPAPAPGHRRRHAGPAHAALGRDSHPGLPVPRAGRLGHGAGARRVAAPALTTRRRSCCPRRSWARGSGGSPR